MSYVENERYLPAFQAPEVISDDAWVLIKIENKLLMKRGKDKLVIPELYDCKSLLQPAQDVDYIGTFDGHHSYCTKLSEELKLSEDFELVELRQITDSSGDPGLFLLAGTANHLLHWSDMNQFCGRCGHKMMNKTDERAKLCPNCSNAVYPRISPATITAVFKENQILLAHNKNFRKDLYSLIAGFVEPGETLEQCVAREIQEEVGIEVRNIKYFSSQPWPFPDSLMIAFTAEYVSGDITVDNCEILDAGWYSADTLPEIPTTDSVAGKMIRWYRDQNMK